MNTRKLFCFGTLVCVLALCGLAFAADEDAELVRKIDELGQLGPRAAQAVPMLTDSLKDDSAEVRAHAAYALGEIGPPAQSAVKELVGLLKDPVEAVRRQAIRALLRVKPDPRVVVPACMKLLEDSDAGVRVRVLHAIAEAGPEAVPGLIQALKNDNAAYWACLALREIGQPAKAAVPALIEKLDDKRPEVRREAILALAAMETAAEPAAARIAAALDDELTSHAATYALGRIGSIPPGVETKIRANVESADKTLGITSLWTLVRVHLDNQQLRRMATARFVQSLKDEDALVRSAAAQAIASLPPAPEITLPLLEAGLRDADETALHHALDALAAIGPAATPALINALKHEKLRGHVAYIIGRIGPDAAAATPELVKLIADKDEHVSLEAIIALANIGPGAKDAVPTLIKALSQSDHPHAHAAAYALGRIGPDAAAAEATLVGLLDNSDRKLALVSAWALAQMRPAKETSEKILPVLKAGLADDTALARRGAAEALGRLGHLADGAIDDLEKATHDADQSVSRAAEDALKAIRGA
jgi:HEAT repeat protein